MIWYVVEPGHRDPRARVRKFGHPDLALEWAALAAAIVRAGGRRAMVVGRIGGRLVRII